MRGNVSEADKGDGAVGGEQDRFPLFALRVNFILKTFQWNVFNEKSKCCCPDVKTREVNFPPKAGRKVFLIQQFLQKMLAASLVAVRADGEILCAMLLP